MSTEQNFNTKSTADLRSLAVAKEPEQRLDLFTTGGIELAYKLAKFYQTSNAVPAAFRDFVEKKDNNGSTLVQNPNAIGNCIVAIETAQSTGFAISAVMQNAHVIEGKLSWSAQFVIAAINASKRFTPLRFKLESKGMVEAKYKEKGAWNKDAKRYDMIDRTIQIENLVCIAYAYIIENGVRTEEKIESIPVSMKMAVEEGWYAKAGSKWQTEMKLQMLQYRAATFFGRINAPDVLMGFGQTSEEREDVIDIHPQSDGSYSVNAKDLAKKDARVRKASNDSEEKKDSVVDVDSVDSARPNVSENGKNESKSANEVKEEETPAKSETAPAQDDAASKDYAYALSLIESGALDEALDFSRSLHPDDAAELSTIIAEKKKEREPKQSPASTPAPAATPARRTREASVDMGS
ncbi:MAG: hypothetical protein K2Y28_04655 [Burkholderiaceae bacterium]|nr:hypothetical protein [Burkholderiaceae bacterium]